MISGSAPPARALSRWEQLTRLLACQPQSTWSILFHGETQKSVPRVVPPSEDVQLTHTRTEPLEQLLHCAATRFFLLELRTRTHQRGVSHTLNRASVAPACSRAPTHWPSHHGSVCGCSQDPPVSAPPPRRSETVADLVSRQGSTG